MADVRVVYGGAMRPATRAPELMVKFECERGHGMATLDAYKGVPFCSVCLKPLRGISVIHPVRANRRPEDPAMVDSTGIGMPYVEPPSDAELWRAAGGT